MDPDLINDLLFDWFEAELSISDLERSEPISLEDLVLPELVIDEYEE